MTFVRNYQSIIGKALLLLLIGGTPGYGVFAVQARADESDITDIQSQIDETRKDQQTLQSQQKTLNNEIDSLGTDCSGIDPTDPTYAGACNCSGSPACTAADFKVAGLDLGTEESTADSTCLSDLYQGKPSLVGFSASCKKAMNGCGLVKCYEKVESDQKQLKEIQSQLDSDKSDLQNYTQELTDAQKACPDCQLAEQEEEASKPTTGELVLGGLQAVLGAGVSGLGIYSQIHGENEYYSSVKDELNQCATIGVPCSGGIGMYGAGGYGAGGYGAGGYGAGGYGFSAGGYGGGGIGIGYPMMGYGSIMGSIVGMGGIVGSISGMGYPTMGYGSMMGSIVGMGGIVGSISGMGYPTMGYPTMGYGSMMGSIMGMGGIVGSYSGYPAMGLGAIAGMPMGYGSYSGYPMMGYPSMGMGSIVGLGGIVGSISGMGYPAMGLGAITGMPMGYGSYSGYPMMGYPSMGMGSIVGMGGIVGSISGMGYGSYSGYPSMGMSLGAIAGMPFGYTSSPYTQGYGVPLSSYGAGFSSGLNPYASTYQESLQQQALMAQEAQGSSSSVMMAEQQVYQAQARAMQLMEGGGYGGAGGGFGIGGSLYGGASTTGLGSAF